MVFLARFTASPALTRFNTGLDAAVRLLSKIPPLYWRGLVLFLAVIWACKSVSHLFWALVPLPTPPVGALTPVMSWETPQSAKAPINIEGLLAAHLFGNYEAELATKLQQQQETAKAANQITKLDLKLQGIIASNQQALSWAIIGDENNQQLYKVGDAIPPAAGVTLAKVEDLRVILNNNGQEEALWLYGEDSQNALQARSAPPAPIPTAPPNTPPPPPSAAAPQQATISQEQIQSAQSIGDVVRFMVATDDKNGGRMIGYKVRPGRKQELFDQVGLKNDDIVISVNGIELNEPQKVREVYQVLKTATEANLQVLRDGNTQSIQIRMSSG